MRINLEGDWAAVWTFGIGATITALVAILVNDSTEMVLWVQYAMSILYLGLAIIFAWRAKTGREVPEGSTWVSWGNTGSDPFFVFFGGCFLYAVAAGMAIIAHNQLANKGLDYETWIVALLGLMVGCWGIFQVNFTARVIVFMQNKSVVLLNGRLITFWKHVYNQNDWLGLHVTWKQGYSGGMYKTAPDNLYLVFGVCENKLVQLNMINIPKETKRVEAVKQLRQLVENTAAMTGLAVPPFPADDELYFNLY